MKKTFLIMAVSSALATFGQQQNINMKYPQTKKGSRTKPGEELSKKS